MRQIGEAHQPEDQREAGCEEKKKPSECQAVQGLNDPDLHLMPVVVPPP
jgi:hypothetical protein